MIFELIRDLLVSLSRERRARNKSVWDSSQFILICVHIYVYISVRVYIYITLGVKVLCSLPSFLKDGWDLTEINIAHPRYVQNDDPNDFGSLY